MDDVIRILDAGGTVVIIAPHPLFRDDIGSIVRLKDYPATLIVDRAWTYSPKKNPLKS